MYRDKFSEKMTQSAKQVIITIQCIVSAQQRELKEYEEYEEYLKYNDVVEFMKDRKFTDIEKFQKFKLLEEFKESFKKLAVRLEATYEDIISILRGDKTAPTMRCNAPEIFYEDLERNKQPLRDILKNIKDKQQKNKRNINDLIKCSKALFKESNYYPSTAEINDSPVTKINDSAATKIVEVLSAKMDEGTLTNAILSSI